jgi:hypothetical protein
VTKAGGNVFRNVVVLRRFGGPCRGRTYGPLIKSATRAIFLTA